MRKGNFIVIIACLFFIILIHYIGWLKPVEHLFRQFIKPGSGLVYKWSVEFSGVREEFNSVQDLETAYIDLKNKYDEALVGKVEADLLRDENQELRSQLNWLQISDYNILGATVVGKSTELLSDSIILDRGEEDGVKVGLPVIAGGGVLVGKIARVEKDMSVVRLINDQQSKIAATLMNKDKSIGIVEGGYGLSIQMNFIPQNESVPVGELVITSGLEGEIPRGLLIGTVDAVEKEAYQPFQKAIVKPLANLNKINLVSIIISH